MSTGNSVSVVTFASHSWFIHNKMLSTIELISKLIVAVLLTVFSQFFRMKRK